MRCEEVREQLAEHLLGTLEGPADLDVRRHLRGCASCRREMAALGDGVTLFAEAAHRLEPPEELRDRVLTVLEEEWSTEAQPARTPRVRRRWLATAAAAAALVGSLGWGVIATQRASRFEADAQSYQNFLGVLGGQNVRVGVLHGSGPQMIQGNAVVYDAGPGEQSWALVLVKAPGLRGTGSVVLSSPAGATIKLPHPLTFAEDGEASAWLVSSTSLKPYSRVTVIGPHGIVIATGTVAGE